MTQEPNTFEASADSIVTSEEHLIRLDELETLRKEVVSQYDAYTSDQLTFQVNPQQWSLLQVLDHIVTAEKMSAIYIKRHLNGKKYPPAPGFKEKFRYGMLKLAFKLPFKYTAPDIVDSTGKSPDLATLQENWKTIRSELLGIVESTDKELLELGVYKHPRAGLLNMEQALDFMALHIRHHQKQIDRITSHETFPA